MNNKILFKLNEMFDELNKTKEIITLNELKHDIYNDQNLSLLLGQIKEITNVYDPKYLELKKQIIDHPKIKAFHQIEDVIYLNVLKTNNKLKQLFGKKEHHHENN